MPGISKCAWVTTVTDEISAKQAVVLAKSLARVHTTAETVVLTSDFSTIKMLAEYFGSVFPVHDKGTEKSGNSRQMELKLFAWNLEMYRKLVVLNPNTLVLENCDELFELEKDIYLLPATGGGNTSDASLFVIKPSSDAKSKLMKLACSSECLSGITVADIRAAMHLTDDSMNVLPPGYYTSISNNDTMNLDSTNIVHYTDVENSAGWQCIPGLKDYWTLLWNEVEQNTPETKAKEAIAIVGLSCRFPEANNSEEFWELLQTGRSAKKIVPLERLEYSQLFHVGDKMPELELPILKCPIDEFDANFFETSRSEAECVDPQQRLLLEVAWEALENASINPLTLKGGNSGVFAGFWQADYSTLANKNIAPSEFHKLTLGNLFSAAAARISYFLGMNGPNVANESGCSSSLLALHLACESLRCRETNLGLVMGSNLTIDLEKWKGMPMFAKDNRCKTFDVKADGFVRAEGIAVLVVKRLSDAIRDRDNIWGIVRGSGLRNEGTSPSFGTPTALCQELAVIEALKMASLAPEEVDYVEAHGTGTVVGDPVEFAALSAGYKGKTKREKPLIIGSVKTNIGHTEATAGLAGLIKVLLSMRHEMIPRHLNLDTLNPKINLDELPAVIPLEAMAWKRNSFRKRIAGISSFAISGSNVHVIVEEPPMKKECVPLLGLLVEERSSHILTISAKTKNALEVLVGSYAKYLTINPKIDISDFTYTTNVGRAHFKNRISLIGNDVSKLSEALDKSNYIRPSLNSPPKIAFLFSGHGSQYISLSGVLYKTNLVFRNALDECLKIIKQKQGLDIVDVLRQVNNDQQEKDALSVQLTIFSVEYALCILLTSLGIKPDFVVGNNVGEYVAAVAAGIMNLADALSLLSLGDLEQGVTKIKYQPGKCLFVSGATGNLLTVDDLAGGKYWRFFKNTEETVNFGKAVKTAHESGCNVFIEIGFFSETLRVSFPNTLWLPTVEPKKDVWEVLLQSLGQLYANNADVAWEAIHTPQCRKKLELPFYPFQRQKYWINIPKKINNVKIHPLLGQRVLLSKGEDIIYERTFSLREFPYLKDHLVGDLVIMPGAAFLEIILTAGKDLLLNGKSKSNSLLVANDFVIESAMEVLEHQEYSIQVVATPVEKCKSKILITVYSLNSLRDSNGPWDKHACAEVTLMDKESENAKHATETLEDIKSRCTQQVVPKSFYESIGKQGIRLLNAFQSISEIKFGDNESLLTIPVDSQLENRKEYLYHPIVLDAMIQGLVFRDVDDISNLMLPIGMRSSLSFSQDFSEVVFAHVQWGDKGKGGGQVSLYNKANDLLLVMVDLMLVDTSLSAFLNEMRKKKNELPDFFENVWRPSLGPLQSRVDLFKLPNVFNVTEQLEKSMKTYMKAFDRKMAALKDEHCSLRLMKMFHENDLVLEIGKEYDTSILMSENYIELIYIQLFDRYIDIFAEDGYIKRLSNETWKLIKQFPSLEEVNLRREHLEKLLLDYDPIETELLVKSSENLWNVLQGNVDPVSSLFGRDDMNVLDLYSKGKDFHLANARMAQILNIMFKDSSTTSGISNSIVRLLEIGGGSAATSSAILKVLKGTGIPYRYTFTDISEQFFDGARKTLSAFEGVEYNTLNIEEDPVSQNFFPHHYDVIIASNVIHATEDLRTSVGNIRKLLVDGGFLMLQEQLKPVRAVDVIVGILDGYWRFKDFDLRANHCMISQNLWDKIVSQNQFENSKLFSDPAEPMSVLIARARKNEPSLKYIPISSDISKDTCLIYGDGGVLHTTLVKQISHFSQTISLEYKDNDMDLTMMSTELDELNDSHKIHQIIFLCLVPPGSDKEAIYQRALNFCKYILKNRDPKTKLFVITQGAVWIPNQQEKVTPEGAPIWGMIRSLMNEKPDLPIKVVELDPEINDALSQTKEIYLETFETSEQFVCYRKSKKFVPRLARCMQEDGLLSLPKGGFEFLLPSSKKIEDISFKSAVKAVLASLHVEIAVKAFSLNFRDILCIMKPEIFKASKNKFPVGVGMDISGIVSSVGSAVTKFKVGDQVLGSVRGSAASHVRVMENDRLIHKPHHVNWFQAAAVTSAFLTAHHSLITIANLQPNETILLHAAAGGVGLYAIQISRNIGARIIATAGNRRKREYLKSIGLQHVFHSRDLTFGDNIQKLTKGLGVNVVLNFLTGPGFKETTLKSCAKNARFVEIAKMNIWQPEEVEKIRPDIVYTVFDLTHSTTEELVDGWEYLCTENLIKDIPLCRFDLGNIREALFYFMKAKHIGKVVISVPETVNPDSLIVSNDLIFATGSSYLITGGLNGIGLEVAKWMASMGAESLVLVSRSPANKTALDEITKLRCNGCRVLHLEVDVGDWAQCSKLFQTLRTRNSNFPPLKGVIHSAGVISDAIMVNQTWKKFEAVFNAKVNACVNLHNLTKYMHLDHFVIFSSMVSFIAPIGQSNHSAANCFLDSFAYYRHSIGLPAQTINWGAWSDVGAAVNTLHVTRGDSAMQHFNCEQGLASLRRIMSRPDFVQVGVTPLWVQGLSKSILKGNMLFEELANETEGNNERGLKSIVDPKTFWENIQPMDLGDRKSYIQHHVVSIIKFILRLSEKEQVAENQPFSELGIDSLMTIELRNKIKYMVGNKIFVDTDMLNGLQTINNLSQYLAECTVEPNETQSNAKLANEKEIRDLIRQDSILPDDIIATGDSPKVHEVHNILLTGATGQMASYLLRDTLKNPNVAVFCLTRGNSAKHAQKRLVENLQKYSLLDSIDMGRVSVVVGDIALDHLGMSKEEYTRLSENIDMVYHMAAKTSFLEYYKSANPNVSDIRYVNVQGTINILRFAANRRTKRVFYASSCICCNKLTAEGLVVEDFPDDDNNAEGITQGYAITKLVCEKLMKQAVARGIPCIVIRFPQVMGDSITGYFAMGSDVVINQLLLCVQLGIVFAFKGVVPIMLNDDAAALTVKLLTSEDFVSGVATLWPPSPLTVADFVDTVRELGYKMETVSDENYTKVASQENGSDFFNFFQKTFGPDFHSMVYRNTFLLERVIKEQNNICRLSPKISIVVKDVDVASSKTVIRRCLSFAKRSGLFADLGTSSRN